MIWQYLMAALRPRHKVDAWLLTLFHSFKSVFIMPVPLNAFYVIKCSAGKQHVLIPSLIVSLSIACACAIAAELPPCEGRTIVPLKDHYCDAAKTKTCFHVKKLKKTYLHCCIRNSGDIEKEKARKKKNVRITWVSDKKKIHFIRFSQLRCFLSNTHLFALNHCTDRHCERHLENQAIMLELKSPHTHIHSSNLPPSLSSPQTHNRHIKWKFNTGIC